MEPIPLLTSIPEHIRRQDSRGADVGRDYRRRCIESWKRSGFATISVNSRKEIQGNGLDTEWVRYRAVKRDAGRTTGRPLVYLNDLLRVAEDLAPGPVAITNSDVLLDCNSKIQPLLRRISPGQCLVAKRFDIESVHAGGGAEFTHGYDFFAFYPEDIRGYRESDLVLGMPWWDHYLPIFMAVHGISIKPVPAPFVYHLVHHDRWNQGLWVKYGIAFMDAMRSDLAAACRGPCPACTYAENFHRITTSFDTLSRMRYAVNKMRGIRDMHIIKILKQLAGMNVSFLEGEMAKKSEI